MNKKDCEGCANNGAACFSMNTRPRKKWCYMTLEKAIQTEREILKYIDDHKEEPKDNELIKLKQTYNHHKKRLVALLKIKQEKEALDDIENLL